MPFDRPTLAELIDRNQGDIESRLDGSDPRLALTLLDIIAKMHAAAAHGQYAYMTWLAKQLMPDTAEGEYLERWAAIWDLVRLLATAATGEVTVTGNDGNTVPAGHELQTTNGVIYTVDADATIDGGTATVSVTAVEAGDDGNQVAGVTLTLVDSIPGVDSQATVAAGGLTGGSEREDDESLRARLLQRLKSPPQGGNGPDYIRWASEAHVDVTDVWIAANEAGPNEVTVRVMTYGATGDGIPTQPVLDAVEAYIEDGRKPWTVTLDVVAPIAVPLDITISNLVPDTQAVKDAIEASVSDFLRRNAAPGGTILLSQLDESISLAAGEESHTLDAPAANIEHDTGEIPVLGAITYA